MAKILLIDDDPKMRMLVSEFMGHNGHEVIIAQDGAFGVSMSALEYPDLIILDMMMPVMRGPEAFSLEEHTFELQSHLVLVSRLRLANTTNK